LAASGLEAMSSLAAPVDWSTRWALAEVVESAAIKSAERIGRVKFIVDSVLS
jgi:hypothetical protein